MSRGPRLGARVIPTNDGAREKARERFAREPRGAMHLDRASALQLTKLADESQFACGGTAAWARGPTEREAPTLKKIRMSRFKVPNEQIDQKFQMSRFTKSAK